MFDHVPLEITTVTEGFSTRLTFVILLSRVNEYMSNKVRTLGKGFTTHLTCMILLPRVNEHMSDKVTT